MGSGANYRSSDDEEWGVIDYVDGYKVLRQMKDSLSNNLPTYSKTSDIYFKKDEQGNVTQMRVYGKKNARDVREPVMDVDLGYKQGHPNSGNSDVPDGVLHIHDFHKTGEGKFVRDKEARPPTLGEMGKYYRLWKKANPNVKVKLKF